LENKNASDWVHRLLRVQDVSL